MIRRRLADKQERAERELFGLALHVDALNGGGAVYSLHYAPKKDTP